VLARIDCERARLQWQPEALQQYCLDQYGQIRACLTDDELISLLLALRQLEIGIRQRFVHFGVIRGYRSEA
jgi:hypothetical protein